MNRGAVDIGSEKTDWMQRRERGSRFALAFMTWLSLAAGRAASRVVLVGIAAYFVVFGGKSIAASKRYLAQCLGRKVSWLDSYKHVLAFATTIHDRVYLLNDQFDRFDIRLVGAEALNAHYEQGEGILLFGAHLGSFEVLRALARKNPKLRMSMAMYPENARQINGALATINPSAVQDIISLGTLDSMLLVYRRLNEGALVGILADRASGPDQYLTSTFLGKTVHVPSGPFRMACMLKRPVYFMAGLYLGGNRYEVHFERLDTADSAESAGSAGSVERNIAVSALLQGYVRAMEHYCKKHPYNWFNFFDYWEKD